MEKTYIEYLDMLTQLGNVLDELFDVAQAKIVAARCDNLVQLDQCMKKDQALSLQLRSLEQKREKVLKELKLENTTLNQLVEAYPPDLQLKAKAVVEDVQGKYQRYSGTSKTARIALEGALHQVEKIITERFSHVDVSNSLSTTDIRA